MSDEIKQLEARVNELEAQLRAARAELMAARVARTGITCGDIVINRKGMEFRVSKVDPFMGGKAWLSGNPRRKDGSWSAAERNLYSDWTKPEAVADDVGTLADANQKAPTP